MRARSLYPRLSHWFHSLSWRTEQSILWIRAGWQRSRLSGVTFVGITGSAGKTTTKDLCTAVLSRLGPCQSTARSGNEDHSVARTILSTTRQHRYSVVELSAGRPGYLDKPLRLLKPHIAVLTVVAREHYSAFRGAEAVASEKGKLIAVLPPDGTAVLNIDDPAVRSIGERHGGRVIWVGRAEGASLRLREASSSWPEPLMLTVEHAGRVLQVPTHLHGTHLALPVLCALGVGLAAGLPLEAAIAAAGEQQPTEGRMQVVTSADGVVFVRDDWKAPHWSMQAPLDFMRDATAARKVVVLGSVSDSARSPSQRYPQLARDALQVVDLVVVVGSDALHALKARPAERPESLQAFVNLADAARFLRDALGPGDLVLLKGTNRADHLVRLLLDRERPVQCWRGDCRRTMFCDRCPQAYAEGATALTAVLEEPPREALARRTESAPLVTVVGLGNPGPEHTQTPHNVGYRTVDAIVAHAGARWTAEPEGLTSRIQLEGMAVALLKPRVSINRSGSVVQPFLDRIGGDRGQLIVVHDDTDIELGDARAKLGGGDGGHKGLRSIVSALGSDQIRRVRVGVRRPGDAREARDLVLKPFSAAEESVLATGLARAEATLHGMIEATRLLGTSPNGSTLRAGRTP